MSSNSTNDRVDRGPKLSDFTFHVLAAMPLVAFLWLYRFLPLQDYPDWLFQGFIFSGLITGHRMPGYSVRPFPVPNSTGTVLMGLLGLVVAPEIAGKCFLTAALLAFIAGSIYLITASDENRPNPLSYLPFLFALNIFFFSGYINYIFSLGLLFGGIGYLIRSRRAERPPRPSLLAVLSLAIYFSHVLSFLAWLVALGAFVLCDFNRSRAKLAALAALPSVVLLAWYTMFRLIGDDVGMHLVAGNVLIRKAIDGVKVFALFSTADLAPTGYGPLKLLGAINIVCAVLVALLGVQWLRRLRATWLNESFLVVACLSYLAIFLFAPAWIGGEWWPGDRLLYPAAWIVFASVGAWIGRRMPDATKAAIKWVILSLFTCQIAYLNWSGQTVSHELSRTYLHLQENEPVALVQLCNSYRHRRQSPAVLGQSGGLDSRASLSHAYDHVGVPSVEPQYHLPYYLWIERRQPALIFPTGLLQYRPDGRVERASIEYESMVNFGERSLCEPPLPPASATTAR